jgi:hypothetical protein
MRALTLVSIGVVLLGAAVAHTLAIQLGLDGGVVDWRIVALMVAATGAVYGIIRA